MYGVVCGWGRIDLYRVSVGVDSFGKRTGGGWFDNIGTCPSPSVNPPSHYEPSGHHTCPGQFSVNKAQLELLLIVTQDLFVLNEHYSCS